MAARKTMFKNRGDLANKLALLEGGKHQAIVGDIRQALRLLVVLEAVSILAYRKSIMVALRREAKELAKRKRKKPQT